MRYIAKLSLMFLLALTAQANSANAEINVTTIVCKGEGKTAFPSMHASNRSTYPPWVVKFNTTGFISFKNIPACDIPIYSSFITNPDKLEFKCYSSGLGREPSTRTITVDRVTGRYEMALPIEPRGNGDNLWVWHGQCSKAKRKF